MIDARVFDRLIARLREGKSFLIAAHVRLDGDGIGSALAVESVLRGLGKKTMLLMPGMIPCVFKFLPGAERIVNLEDTPDAKLPADLDTFIVVDVADMSRLGGVKDLLPPKIFTISIDHHRTGDLRADVDCDDSQASSTGEIIHRLLTHGRLPITPDVATNIYAAVMTDTQRFTLPNTTGEALRIAAEMVDAGADPGDIGDRVYRSYLPGQLTLWGEVASHVQTDLNGKLAWTSLTEEMLERHKVHADDTQEFADIPRMLAGVEVGVLFRECPGSVRVSLRSNRLPILSVAEKFGGGGHALACGCELDAPIDETSRQVLDAVREVIRKKVPE